MSIMNEQLDRAAVPDQWDRSGLPAWTYHSEEMTKLEMTQLFRRTWQLACHLSDLPHAGSYVTLDIAGDRAIVMRGGDNQVRAFHNLCRHRGSRVLADRQGRCPRFMVCPFHGWRYNLDGTLQRPFLPESLPDLDKEDFGLKPIELQVWMGFVFLRFAPGDQDPIAEVFARHDAEVGPYRTDQLVPDGDGFWSQEVAVNWKAVRDVDNEGYHVPVAHPGLQDLYGPNYYDEPLINGTNRSFAAFTPETGRNWSVRAYKNLLPSQSHLPEGNQRAWLYIGLFPNTVLSFYPESVMFYQEFPLAKNRTLQRGSSYRYADEDRALRVARYLSGRIDSKTGDEDRQLIEWTYEAMASSAFDGIVLSDREYGVRSYHDMMRAVLPVMNLENEPLAGTLAERNAALLAED